jgi:hypothetical protein
MFNTFSKCPLLYKRLYIEKREQSTKVYDRLAFGNAMHKILNNKDYSIDLKDKTSMILKVDTTDIKKEETQEETQEEPKKKPHIGMTYDMTKRLNLRQLTFDGKDSKLIYREQLVSFDFTSDLTLVGILDYLEFIKKHLKYNGKTQKIDYKVDDCLILDWKTGNYKITVSQLDYYSMLVFNRILDLKQIKVGIGHITKEDDKLNIDIKETRIIKRYELGKIERDIMTIIYSMLDTKKFNAKPGALCKYCPFRCLMGIQFLG